MEKGEKPIFKKGIIEGCLPSLLPWMCFLMIIKKILLNSWIHVFYFLMMKMYKEYLIYAYIWYQSPYFIISIFWKSESAYQLGLTSLINRLDFKWAKT